MYEWVDFSKFPQIFMKILEKTGNFAQYLAQNWTHWYMNGCHSFLKNWYLYGSTFKVCGGISLPKPNLSTPGGVQPNFTTISLHMIKRFGKSILEVPDTGTSQYWWILEHFWCTSIILPENMIFTFFRTCRCYSEAFNTGMQEWSSIVQYSCTRIWDLKYTFSKDFFFFLSKVQIKAEMCDAIQRCENPPHGENLTFWVVSVIYRLKSPLS